MARCITVTILQAKIRHAKEDQSEQILVGVPRWRHDLLEHVHGRTPVGITHRRQVDERLDRSAPELLHHVLIFLLDFFVCRVRRPCDTGVPEIGEADLDGAVAPTQGRRERHA